MSENKKYTIVIKRQHVEVSEAVYRASIKSVKQNAIRTS